VTIDERHVLIDPPDEVDAVADRILAAVDRETLVYRSRSS